MAKTINLRQHRKRKARAEQDQRAAEQRARHGRTLAQKRGDAASESAAQAMWQGHRREEDDSQP